MTVQPGVFCCGLVVYQNASFDQAFIICDEDGNPIDLTGYTARMQARRTYFTEEAYLTLTTSNGGIVLGTTDGTMNLIMSAEQTGEIDVEEGVFDVLLINGSTFIRIIQGELILSFGVTTDD